MPLPIEAVVFDFDGLILDTETPEVNGWNAEFASHGLTIPEAWWAGLTGRGPEEVLEWPQDLLERLLERKLDHEATLARVNKIRLAGIAAASIQPGVVELLDRAGALGIPVAICSSSKHDWVEGHLSRKGMLDRFPVIVCRGDAPRAKPHPDLYLLACEKLSVKPEKALALEDSPNGIAAAKAAGMRCIACPNSVTVGLDLSRADRIVSSLLDVDLGENL